LLVACLRSPFVSDAQRSRFKNQIEDRLTVVDLDCGHIVYWEAFEETARAVWDFLGR
jgi:hypothetical protein